MPSVVLFKTSNLDNKVRVSKAEEIFAQHLAAEAPEPVNVDSGQIFCCWKKNEIGKI